MNESYFPILVQYTGETEHTLVNKPNDLRNNESFTIVETRVKAVQADDGKKLVRYKVMPNKCDCHPETCNCDPYKVVDAKGLTMVTCNQDAAESIAAALNEQAQNSGTSL